jgi:hypothetical protein
MSDDQAPESDQVRGPRTRPAFLPPVEGHPPPAYGVPYPARDDAARHGTPWNIGVIIAGAVLLVSAFLPWAEARITIDLFGRLLSRDLGSVAGLEADNVVVAVPVLAMVAIAMAFWGIVGRDTRVSALACVPGLLALLVCGLFVLRLDDIKDRLAAEDLSVGYQIAVVNGWYLAVAMSLLVVGFSLARPLTRRIGAARSGASVAARPVPSTQPSVPEPGAQVQWMEQQTQPQAQWQWPDRQQPPDAPGAPGAGQS